MLNAVSALAVDFGSPVAVRCSHQMLLLWPFPESQLVCLNSAPSQYGAIDQRNQQRWVRQACRCLTWDPFVL